MKTILITGASSGIGKAAAIKFAANGWNVIATMRSPEKEQELTLIDNVFITRLDVQNTDSINQAIQAELERFRRIATLLNNAGYMVIGASKKCSLNLPRITNLNINCSKTRS